MTDLATLHPNELHRAITCNYFILTQVCVLCWEGREGGRRGGGREGEGREGGREEGGREGGREGGKGGKGRKERKGGKGREEGREGERKGREGRKKGGGLSGPALSPEGALLATHVQSQELVGRGQ